MTIFNHAHFLRHISLPTLRQFTDAHPLGPELAIDWGQPEDTLPRLLNDALTIKQDSLSNAELSLSTLSSISMGSTATETGPVLNDCDE